MTNQKILHLGSSTPGAVPLPSQLITNTSGVEIAINAADGKLFYKDSAGVVRVLADVRTSNVGVASLTSGTINGVDIGVITPGEGAFTSVFTAALTVSSLTGLLKSSATLGVSAAVAGVDYLAPASRGTANGVASLDSTAHIPLSQLPPAVVGALYYAGFWDAATNTPALASSVGTNGVFYKVSVAGSTNLNGANIWAKGDTVIFNGTQWGRLQESSAPVQSVNGLTGAVSITAASLGAATAGANSNITSLSGLTTVLSVTQGGTGGSGVTGLVKGNGGSAYSAAAPGVDYAVPPTGGNAQLLANDGAGGFANVALGNGLLYANGTLSATSASTGTVTSVNMSGGTTGLTVSNGPITNAGTLALGGLLNIVSGGTGASSRQGAINALAGSTISGTYLRANGNDVIMSGIQASDIPTLNQNTTGSAATVTEAAQPLITSLGVLTSVRVGGNADLGGPLRSAGNPGAAGQILTSAGMAGPPIWRDLDHGATNGTVTSVQVTGGTTGLTFGGGPVTSSGTMVMGGVLSVSAGGTGVTTSTGSGGIVKEQAPLISGATLVNGEANNLLIGASTPTSAAFTTVALDSMTAGAVSLIGELNLSDSSARLIAGTSGVAGQVLISGGASAPPSWATAGTVSSVQASGGTTGLTFTGGPITSSGTLVLDGTLAVTNGGTGASSSTGTGSVVLSDSPTLVTPNLGLPSFIDLSNGTDLPFSSTTGIVPVVRGGTGNASITGLVKGNGAFAFTPAVAHVDYALPTTGNSTQLLSNDGSGGFTNVTLGTGLSLTNGILTVAGAGSVSSVNVGGGTTGLVFTGGPITSSGVMVMSGILSPANGGTGADTLTGLVKGNGTAAFTSAVAGVDYAPATTATTAQLLAGNGNGGFNNVIVGDGLFLANGTLTSASGTGTVTSIEVNGGTTGLTFSGGEITSSGVATMSGRLSVASGGTGASSLFGILKGGGTSAVTSAVPGVDYAPATTATLQQLLAGNGGGGFTNVDLGQGLAYVNGILNTTGMGPTGSVLSFNSRQGAIVPEAGDYTAEMIPATQTTNNSGSTVQAQLAILGSTTGTNAIGYTRSGSGFPRTLTDKLSETLSVTDFGADSSGGMPSLVAFTQAYNLATPGQVILIPSGLYQGVSGALAGTKHVTWLAYGYPTGVAPQLWNLPGKVVQYAASATPNRVLELSKALVDDGGSGTKVVRNAVFAGGNPNVANTAYSIGSVVSSSNTNTEYALEVTLSNSASTSGNAALKVSTDAAGAGSVTSAWVDVLDNNSQPAKEVTGLTVSVSALGADDLSNRNGLVIKPVQVGTARTVVGAGLKVETSTGAVFTNGAHFVGEFESALFVDALPGTGNGLRISGSAAAGISIEGTPTVGISVPASTNVGIDLSTGIHTTSALRIRDGDKLSFTGSDSTYLAHVAGGLTHYSGGSAKHQLVDNGDLFLAGRLSLTSSTVTSAAGAPTGTFVSVLIDGTAYKLELRSAV